MKKIKYLLFGLVAFLFPLSLTAQTIVHVPPGLGTLNDSIKADGSAIYLLQPGGWYGLNATLQITTPVQIIGGDTTAGMPAMIQTGSTTSGTTFAYMFVVHGNLTIRNVFLVNADLNNGIGIGTFQITAPDRLLLDSVTVDPVGRAFFIRKGVDSCATYVTNSLIMGHGNTTSINDGWLFNNQNNGMWDTLYVENNTFVDVGTDFLIAGAQKTDRENLVWINHNSFFFGKANFFGFWGPYNAYVTNNLMWNYDFNPIKNAWSAFQSGKLGSLIWTDTLRIPRVGTTDTTETLPSSRDFFLEYNSNFRSQGVWDLVSQVNDSATTDSAGWLPTYLYDFIPSPTDSTSESQMFNSKTSFPGFYCNNNISDSGSANPADDPDFLDPHIAALTDSAIAWAKQSTFQLEGHMLSAPSAWPNYFYYPDTGGVGDPMAWPRFNGVYSNSKLLTASIEGLPLGDLNWFPKDKVLWEENKAAIMQHILSENESRMTLTAVTASASQLPTKFILSQNYPNPFNPTTQIEYSIPQSVYVTLKVFNVLGQEVATLFSGMRTPGRYVATFNASKYASGVYFYRIQAGHYSATKKLMLVK